MDYREVREILDKYWQGTSSLQEEELLKNFFSTPSDDLPNDLQEVAGLFQFYKEAASQTTDEISFSPMKLLIKEKNLQGRKIVRLMKRYWEYAAIFLLILCSVWLIRPVSKTRSLTSVNKDTFQDPGKAMKATQQALQIVAANLNKGREQMQKLALFNKAEQAIRQDQ